MTDIGLSDKNKRIQTGSLEFVLVLEKGFARVCDLETKSSQTIENCLQVNA